tara:strand:+ start:281928 stop:282110 length:183 start_codon:yes stop_codon:yes gene_type:complete
LTPFDLKAKVKQIGQVTVDDYLANAQKYLYSWNNHEKAYLENIITQTEKQIKKNNIDSNG